jgi:hypothetical protein
MMEVKENSLIYVQDQMLTHEECVDIIRRFEADPRKVASSVGFPPRVDPSVRATDELHISAYPEWKDVDKLIQAIVSALAKEMIKTFPGLNSRNLRDQGYYVLRYRPGAHYAYHCDFNSTSRRQLGFIFYLNTLEEGATHFDYWGVRIQPIEGRIAFFPPFWTHRHAGLPPEKDKYVIVTWLEY